MSDEQQTGTDTSDVPDPAQPDWYLQALIGIVNGKDIEFPITLFVGGLIVSGLLTSGHKYFQGLGEQLTQFFGGPSEETSKTVGYFTSPGDIYTEDTASEPKPPPQFIHLRAAMVFSPGQTPIPNGGSWWRGRVANVDAFHFGSLSASES